MTNRKEYPLDVDCLASAYGDPTLYYSKGHHDFTEFAAKINYEFEEDEPVVDPSKCRHVWMRWEPDPDREFPQIGMIHDKPGRGCFPATVYEI